MKIGINFSLFSFPIRQAFCKLTLRERPSFESWRVIKSEEKSQKDFADKLLLGFINDAIIMGMRYLH